MRSDELRQALFLRRSHDLFRKPTTHDLSCGNISCIVPMCVIAAEQIIAIVEMRSEVKNRYAPRKVPFNRILGPAPVHWPRRHHQAVAIEFRVAVRLKHNEHLYAKGL